MSESESLLYPHIADQSQFHSITKYTETVVPFNYKYLMIIFLVIKYFWEQYINLRQLRRNLIKDIPEELAQYRISTNQFLLTQSYSFDKITFEMLALSIRMAVNVLSISCNLLPYIWQNVHKIFPFISIHSQFQLAVGYTLIESFKHKAFQVPISAYQTFVIQKKYNFTNKTMQLFIYDLFVEAALMLIIFPPIIYGYLQVVQVGGEYFYVFLQGFVICVTVVLTWIHPNVIAPLFNKFTQLQDQDLKLKIYTIANKNSIKISNIYVINSSVRSAHSNAYLYGLGTTKSIVLYDNLLQSLTKQQILSVLTHEMGHSYYSHSIKKLLVYLVEVMSMFYIFSQFVKNQEVFTSFGFGSRSVFICTALYFHMFQPLTSIFNTLLLVVTRKFQFQADLFSCQQGSGEQLKKSLIKLFKESTSTVRPDFLYAWIKHSHPSIYERIESINVGIEKYRKKHDDASRQRKKQSQKSSSNRQYPNRRLQPQPLLQHQPPSSPNPYPHRSNPSHNSPLMQQQQDNYSSCSYSYSYSYSYSSSNQSSCQDSCYGAS